MKRFSATIAGLVLAATWVQAAEAPVKKKTMLAPPVVEVAFVLDTTGSMGGLIEGAKAKIWSIANQIVLGKPRPKVRMALVPYRDKGDDFVTKVFPLTDNIDQVYSDLMKFSAGGGGDGPENVNQGLYDAIHKLQWTPKSQSGPNVVRIIYLVGDCPPHNEYKDVPTYDKLAKAAIEKGIYVNTILCGNNGQARKIWQEIARRAEGTFVAIRQDGGVETIATPYDDELAKANTELVKTAVVFGTTARQDKARKINAEAASMAVSTPGCPEPTASVKAASADRAKFAVRSGRTAEADLLDGINAGKVKLADLKKEELPAEMKDMSETEQKAYVAEKQTRREKVQKQIVELSRKRDAYIRAEQAKSGAKRDGFDEQVVEGLRKQAAKAGIDYK